MPSLRFGTFPTNEPTVVIPLNLNLATSHHASTERSAAIAVSAACGFFKRDIRVMKIQSLVNKENHSNAKPCTRKVDDKVTYSRMSRWEKICINSVKPQKRNASSVSQVSERR